MNLSNKIEEDIKISLKSGDKFKLSVLRMLKTAMQVTKKNQRDELSDEEVMAVLKTQVKIRKASMEEYLSYNRQDLADNLSKEIDVLSEYLPEELSDDAIKEVLDEIFDKLKPTTIKDMGNIMKEITERIGNQVDMKKVSSIVRERLS